MKYIFKDVYCNICGNNKTAYLGRRVPRAFNLPESLKMHIVRCNNCSLIYPNPMAFPDFEQLQFNYSNPDDYFPISISAMRFNFYKNILRQIENLLGYKGRLLDVGCGRGELLYVAKTSGWQAIGIECSLGFAKYAKNKFGVEVIVSQLPELNIPPETFDAVCLISVLQHVYDPKGTLVALSRVLSKNGLIFIETLNNESIIYKLGDLYYRLRGKRITTHLSPTFPSYQVYGFSYKSIKSIFKEARFKIIKIEMKGGISATERTSIKGIIDAILRYIRTIIVIIANFIKQGQVLIVYGRKL